MFFGSYVKKKIKTKNCLKPQKSCYMPGTCTNGLNHAEKEDH